MADLPGVLARPPVALVECAVRGAGERVLGLSAEDSTETFGRFGVSIEEVLLVAAEGRAGG